MKEGPIIRILHPNDLSASAEASFNVALDLALRTGASLHTLHVVSGPRAYLSEPDLSEKEEKSILLQLQEIYQRYLGVQDEENLKALEIDTEIVEGLDVAAAIVEHARRQGSDVIVLGTHGRRGLSHMLLGSVAEAVIRKAPCPTLIVRDQPGVQRMPVKHILAPLDFSSYSREALVQAKKLAALYHASLTLLFVAEEQIVPFFSDTGIPTFTLVKMDDDLISQAKAALKQLDASLPEPEVPTTIALRHGHAYQEIVRFAEEEGIDLIVMGTRGIGNADESFIGRVTERVMRTASCPVWAVNSVRIEELEEEPLATSVQKDVL